MLSKAVLDQTKKIIVFILIVFSIFPSFASMDMKSQGNASANMTEESAYLTINKQDESDKKMINTSIVSHESPEKYQSTSASSTEAANRSEKELFSIHVYVFNQDDDTLDISLFIDSDLKDTKTVSSDSEMKFDSYQLQKGPHDFEISWWEEDTKKNYEVCVTNAIENQSSVNLYALKNEEPEEFEITVQLTNENLRDLEAFLYIDDNFEKSKEADKESTIDLGTIKLEEGTHNLSIKWQDKDTKIEYEKKKKITVTRDEAVVFYAPKGISFESKESLSDFKTEYTSENKKEETYSNEKKSLADEDRATNETTNSPNNITLAEPKGISKTETRQNSFRGASYSRLANPLTESAMDNSNYLYIYAALVIVSVYLILRH